LADNPDNYTRYYYYSYHRKANPGKHLAAFALAFALQLGRPSG
jgi:hypothetical protein